MIEEVVLVEKDLCKIEMITNKNLNKSTMLKNINLNKLRDLVVILQT
jgi:hypothetical protein